MRSRAKAILMLSVWTLSIFNGFTMEVSGADTSNVYSIKNNVIELLVNKHDGRFAVKTAEGSPNRPEDDNEPLLYSNGIPETSFTTFRIEGKDYIYGNSYTGILMDGGLIDAPKSEGMVNISTWKAEGVEITQKLEMTENVSSSDVGNVKISYTIANKGTSSKTIGTRILMDTMLGGKDGSRVSLDGKSDIIFEKEVSGEDIPVYWRCADSIDDPKVVSYGFIKGWGNAEPDRMTVAHWNALSSTKWDYSINPDRNIGSALNDYKSADSAVALYWEPKALEPGKSIEVVTYYGLGNVRDSNDGSTFDLNVLSPSKLSIENDEYKDNPFDIIMELNNDLAGSTELAGITAELVLPEGLELAEGEQSSIYFHKINAKSKATASWSVRALNTQDLKVLQYMIKVASTAGELRTIKKFIIIPGFENNEFDIGYTDVVPRNLYYNDENNAIQLIGYGFDKLKDKSSYEASIVNTRDGIVHYFSAEDISIVNDNQMRIRIPKGMEIGIYRVAINHKNDMMDYTLSQQIMLTSDTRYKSRNYGILVINEENAGGKVVQNIKLYENESQVTAADKSSAKLIIRGKVRSVSNSSYDIYGDNIAINNDIYFKGYEDNVLSVYKEGDSYKVKGDGELYMQSALMGSSMGITLKKGNFYIDSKTTVIKDTEGEFNDLTTIYVGYFPILVKEIRIQGNGEVKIDGILQLENKYFKFLTSVGTGAMKSDLKDLSITNKKIDIDAEIQIPFPRWKLGGFQSKDYVTKAMTEITFFINTIEGAYGFETKAQNPKLRLLDINAKMAFDKNLYPDYFEFENNYGKIPKPIGSTGLGFESIGGGIYGLKSMIDSLRYGILPTGSSIAARANIVDLLTANLRIKGYTMVGLRDIEAVLSSRGIDLDGKGYIYFIPVGDIEGHFDFNGGYIEADLDILDIIVADAYFGISSHEIKASINADVNVPDYVWFIGGETIAGFGAELSTKKIEGSVEFLGVGVGIKYLWEDNEVDFEVAAKSGIDSKGIYTVKTKDDQGRNVTVTYGTNIEKLKEIEPSYYVAYAGDMGKMLALGASTTEYEVPIDASYESAIIEMKYTSSDTPGISVTDPVGNPYALVDGVNFRNQVIPAAISESGLAEKRLFVTIAPSISGTWKVESDKVLTLTPYKVKVPAAFESFSAGLAAGKININWELNKTSDTKVSLYLIGEDGISESIELAKDLNGGVETYTCDIPTGITTGNYKVRGEVKRSGIDVDDEFSFDNMDSAVFEIIDAAAPAVPTGFVVEAVGNSMMKAEWNNIEGVDEYRIYPVDINGNIDKTVKNMLSVDGTETNTVFGGTLKGTDGKEYGWIPGKSYRFALYAVKVTGAEGSEVEHISKPVYSGEVSLPVPEPPVFTVGFTSEYGIINIGKDMYDNEIRYTNTEDISCRYQSDTVADVVFHVNGDEVADGKVAEIEQELEIKSGSNFIEIEAVGVNGDKTLKSYEIYYDDKAPDLMVQSPNSTDTIKTGTVLVSGKTTAGSKLYVNGTQMTVEEDGSFNEEYILSSMQRETITIAAVDLAGNRTEYSTEVLNSEVSNMAKVQIIPQIVQMRVGDSLQMRLYGITKDNNQVLLETDKTEWQLYDTEGAASMTVDGLLKAEKPGEIIINGQYAVSNDTIYEDALIIKVLAKAAHEDEDRDEDDSEDSDRNIIKTNSLIKKFLDFKANEEITIPGLISLRFTGDELLENGYIEIYEINDLLQYRQQSGNKDFLSDIFDIKVTEDYQFTSPVELTIYFDKNKVKNIKNIGIYVYNEKNGIWDMLGGVIDEVKGSITIKLPHFSKYAVMENSGMRLMTDMDGHWARDAVYRLIDRGIVNGVEATAGEYRFEPERTVTRAEFAKMLSLSEGYLQNDASTDLSNFEDDADIQQWARPYMKYCSKKGWIKGKSVGEQVYMKPKDTITRAEAAAMISRAMGFAAVEKVIKAEFRDKEKIPDWAVDYIDGLLEKKLMQGYSDGTFRPEKVLTRAEAAKIFDTYMYEKDKIH